MTELREGIGRAIYEGGGLRTPWDALPEWRRESHRRLADRIEPYMQEKRAEAWDEGFQDGRRFGCEGDDGPRFHNPYKETDR